MSQLLSGWIWYPGDFEVWLHWRVSLRRQERGVPVPPVWRLDRPFSSVTFHKAFELAEPENIRICVEGQYDLVVDGKRLYTNRDQLELAPGKHVIIISVFSETVVPAIWVQGKTLVSDSSWRVRTYYGLDTTLDQNVDDDVNWRYAGCWNFHDPNIPPSKFRLPTTPLSPVSSNHHGEGWLVDFGRETFGFVQVHGLRGRGEVKLYYGETREEALSEESCETFDTFQVDAFTPAEYTLPVSRAFRYIYGVVSSGEVEFESLSTLYEYLPLELPGHFECSDELLNKIWTTAEYTLRLNTREFMLDGIKRDRWVWCGDALQTALMNYYSFFDLPVVRRTFLAVRGKDPVPTHLNLIIDYSFYWFMGLYDYYLYTGDRNFITENYSQMYSLLEFCLNRRNSNGLMEKKTGDWVFVDWAPIDNEGEVSFEQILLCRSLEIMAHFAALAGFTRDATRFEDLAGSLKKQIRHLFWDSEQGGLVHNRHNGKVSRHLTRYPNIFALLLGYLNEADSEEVKQKVLLNPAVQPITTPYMRFYELAALCQAGQHSHVLQEIKAYWGGMLELGATTFWEEYRPDARGVEHYSMYGRPFGKSLCHGWGASPLYLLGKYFLGVEPLTAGYATYRVAPHLGGLSWICGKIPMPAGEFEIRLDKQEIRLKTPAGGGCLTLRSSESPYCALGQFRQTGFDEYELDLDQLNTEYLISYCGVEEQA
ncbi:MAG TPA: alpha-rhamnosidase [Chloroflexia bacterium]|nr:alpha-rhamnosidase [Chloroflexia bacterium]